MQKIRGKIMVPEVQQKINFFQRIPSRKFSRKSAFSSRKFSRNAIFSAESSAERHQIQQKNSAEFSASRIVGNISVNKKNIYVVKLTEQGLIIERMWELVSKYRSYCGLVFSPRGDIYTFFYESKTQIFHSYFKSVKLGIQKMNHRSSTIFFELKDKNFPEMTIHNVDVVCCKPEKAKENSPTKVYVTLVSVHNLGIFGRYVPNQQVQFDAIWHDDLTVELQEFKSLFPRDKENGEGEKIKCPDYYEDPGEAIGALFNKLKPKKAFSEEESEDSHIALYTSLSAQENVTDFYYDCYWNDAYAKEISRDETENLRTMAVRSISAPTKEFAQIVISLDEPFEFVLLKARPSSPPAVAYFVITKKDFSFLKYGFYSRGIHKTQPITDLPMPIHSITLGPFGDSICVTHLNGISFFQELSPSSPQLRFRKPINYEHRPKKTQSQVSNQMSSSLYVEKNLVFTYHVEWDMPASLFSNHNMTFRLIDPEKNIVVTYTKFVQLMYLESSVLPGFTVIAQKNHVYVFHKLLKKVWFHFIALRDTETGSPKLQLIHFSRGANNSLNEGISTKGMVALNYRSFQYLQAKYEDIGAVDPSALLDVEKDLKPGDVLFQHYTGNVTGWFPLQANKFKKVVTDYDSFKRNMKVVHVAMYKGGGVVLEVGGQGIHETTLEDWATQNPKKMMKYEVFRFCDADVVRVAVKLMTYIFAEKGKRQIIERHKPKSAFSVFTSLLDKFDYNFDGALTCGVRVNQQSIDLQNFKQRVEEAKVNEGIQAEKRYCSQIVVFCYNLASVYLDKSTFAIKIELERNLPSSMLHVCNKDNQWSYVGDVIVSKDVELLRKLDQLSQKSNVFVKPPKNDPNLIQALCQSSISEFLGSYIVQLTQNEEVCENIAKNKEENEKMLEGHQSNVDKNNQRFFKK